MTGDQRESLAEEIRLWDSVADATQSEVWTADPIGGRVVHNVTLPSLFPFLPAPGTATGSAVIVAPGGGFGNLQWDKEGVDIAEWLRARGVAAFILKYRLRPYDANRDAAIAARVAAGATLKTIVQESGNAVDRSGVVPLAVEDGRQALRIVRRRAAEWGLDPNRVGLMGFSAGALLTVGVAYQSDDASQPAFIAPIYGAPPDVLAPSMSRLPSSSAALPPMFMMIANNDFPELVEGSLDLVRQWRSAGRRVELHLFAAGGHGFGIRKQGLPVDSWIDRFEEWLGALGHLTVAAPSVRS